MVLLREITREEIYHSSVQNLKRAPNLWLRLLKELCSSLWQDASTLRLFCRLAKGYLRNVEV